MYKKKCKQCDKEFEAKQTRTQFCSSLCNANYNYHKNKKKNRTGQKKQCKNCGKEFTAYRVDKVFCSNDCQWHYRYKYKVKIKKPIKCKNCGTEFIRRQPNHIYCSKECCYQYSSKKYYAKDKFRHKTIKRADGTYVEEHRYVVEQNLDRVLSSNEIVHHIDMNKRHNNEDNLCLCDGFVEHGNCHGSLNVLVQELLEKNIIGFDLELKKYFSKL